MNLEKKKEKNNSIIINSRKKESRLNLLYIFLTLKNYSSAKNPMTGSDIIKKISEDFTDNGEAITLSPSTISRLLSPFLTNENFSFDTLNDEGFYEDIHKFGYKLFCVTKKGNDFIPYTQEIDEPEDKKNTTAKYYYCESIFSDAELRTLIDAIKIYNYFSPSDIVRLTQKLLDLSPQSFTNPSHVNLNPNDANLKDVNSSVLNNIEDFNQYIQKQQMVEINYCNYGYEKNSTQLQLIERSNYPRYIRPLRMMWSNGYYYLMAMLGPADKYSPTNLRMDRILILGNRDATTDEWNNWKPKYSPPSEYRLKHPVMFGGNEEDIDMLCLQTETNGIMNAVMDVFGLLANCRPATQAEIQSHISPDYVLSENEKWIHVHVKTTTGGVILFATQYCRYCKVISPDFVVDAIQNNLKTGLSNYSINTH
jgi:hypothetical protein